MLNLKLLVTIALLLGMGTTGLAAVSVNPGAASHISGMLNAVSTNLGLTGRASTSTHVQTGKTNLGASSNANANTQVSAAAKKENAQHSSNAQVSLNSSASTNASVTTKSNVTASSNVNVRQQLSSDLKVATDIANEFGVSVSDILALHSSGWGYGEIEKLYALAKQSGQSVSIIESMRASGKGWGEIAESLETSLDGFGGNFGVIISGQGTVRRK